MAFYKFQVSVPMTPQFVAERLRSLVHKEAAPGIATNSPFVGSVRRDSFRVRRDIQYHNSFLPQIQGRVKCTRLAHGSA